MKYRLYVGMLLVSMLFALLSLTVQAACYESVKDIPITCNGSVSSDTFNGCRSIVCSSEGETLQVLACDKAGFFEMYKQSPGNKVELCIGETCIKDNGYAKSSTYPICTDEEPACIQTIETCDQKDNDCDGSIDEENVCTSTPPPDTACYTSVKDIPATCEGDSISSDAWNGGRTIVCGDTRIQAWDKAGFFEMYKQAGGNDVTICLGDACIRDNGYAKSGVFPICSAPPVCEDDEDICDGKDDDCDGFIDENYICGKPCENSVQDTLREGETKVHTIGGVNYEVTLVFVGNSEIPEVQFSVNGELTGMISEGNSKKLSSGATIDVRDALVNAREGVASYTLLLCDTCIPAAEVCDESDNDCNGQVDEGEVCQEDACYTALNDIPATCDGTITADEKGGCRKIICASGADSTQVLACEKSGFFEMYRQTTIGSGVSKICIGETCMKDEGYVKSGNYPLCNPAPRTNASGGGGYRATVAIAPDFPVENNYVFICDAPGIDATSYDWNFGDGVTLTRTDERLANYAYHTFERTGTYTITCIARNDTASAEGSTIITTSRDAQQYSIEITYGLLDPQMGYYGFACTPSGFRTEKYFWEWYDEPYTGYYANTGDDFQNISSVEHYFPPGEYAVYCIADIPEKYQQEYYEDDYQECTNPLGCYWWELGGQFTVDHFEDSFGPGNECPAPQPESTFTCTATGEQCSFEAIDGYDPQFGYWTENGVETYRYCQGGYWQYNN